MPLVDRVIAKAGWLVMLLAGGVSALGFAPLGWWPLTLLALVVLMEAGSGAGRLRQALGRGWWFGLGHFTIGLNWIAGAFQYQDAMPVWFGWGAVLALSFYVAVYPAIALGLAWRWGKGDRAVFVLVLAAGWIVTEWLRAALFTGFAWNPLGVVAVGVGQASRLVGSYGLSGLVVLAAGALWLLLRRDGRSAAMVAVLPAMALAMALPSIPEPDIDLRMAQRPLIRVVQPNIGQQDKWRKGYEQQNFARLANLTGKAGAAPRLIFWPEAAIPDYLEDELWARNRIAGLLGPQDVLLTGGNAIIWGPDDMAQAIRNSVFVVDAAGELHGRYDKAHLVPYGEYLPMRPILSAIGLSRLVPGDIDFEPGPGPKSIEIPGFGKMGVQICYEIIFSGEVVDRLNRPDFLFNPSNDAWFGAWGPPQHLAQARLRAIEEGIPVIRSTPTGISAVIDADGAVLRSLGHHRAGAIDARLPQGRTPTLFALYGNSIAITLAMILVAVAIAIRRFAR